MLRTCGSVSEPAGRGPTFPNSPLMVSESAPRWHAGRKGMPMPSAVSDGGTAQSGSLIDEICAQMPVACSPRALTTPAYAVTRRSRAAPMPPPPRNSAYLPGGSPRAQAQLLTRDREGRAGAEALEELGDGPLSRVDGLTRTASAASVGSTCGLMWLARRVGLGRGHASMIAADLSVTYRRTYGRYDVSGSVLKMSLPALI
jgi:hypothetical protein